MYDIGLLSGWYGGTGRPPRGGERGQREQERSCSLEASAAKLPSGALNPPQGAYSGL
ncbi:hypothetical protein MINTM018_52730 (plasmid) [Mycobacterium intracellulare]|uniref:Uncharacterized protein n=1 Tax=Mycobacterium intracellulare TaxID=1767 RepID=A0A7R7MYW2_MYCIT|nr:hypothetical protein MINTM018_52730 [Mycobacterium intracellulare]